MSVSDDSFWTTDRALLESLPGGAELIAWFGGVPTFHDALLERLDLDGRSATIGLKVFRMTDRVDGHGYFLLDRHASVTIRLIDIGFLRLEGDSGTIVSSLGIRRSAEGAAGKPGCAGGLELRIERSVGLEGSIHARRVELSLVPA
jgi:hypothetical protein